MVFTVTLVLCASFKKLSVLMNSPWIAGKTFLSCDIYKLIYTSVLLHAFLFSLPFIVPYTLVFAQFKQRMDE